VRPRAFLAPRSPVKRRACQWRLLDPAAMVCAVALLGCGSAKSVPAQHVMIEVTGGPGEVVQGARVAIRGRVVASTDRDGRAALALDGAEGTLHPVDVRCPEDRYRSPSEPIVLQKTLLKDPKNVPRYGVSCARKAHLLVLALRVEHGAGLPVLHLGKQVARLDEAGAATAAFELGDGERIDLTLDTATEPALLPRSPTLSVQGTNTDDFTVVDFAFTKKEKPKRKRSAASRPRQF